MIDPRPRSGTTLLELIVALMVLGILLGIAVPRIRGALDGYAVSRARAVLGAGVARTRAEAVARGGAVLVADPREGRYWIESSAGRRIAPAVDLGATYGVTISAGAESADGRVRLRFGPLGIGRLTSRTFAARRGDAEAGLTVSAYGRVRRW